MSNTNLRDLPPGWERRTAVIVATLDYNPERMTLEEVQENLPCFVESALGQDETAEDPYHLHNTSSYVQVEDFDADRREGLDHFEGKGGRERLRELQEEAEALRKTLGYALPNEVVWQHEGLSHRYLVIADGLGGGTAQETDDGPYHDQNCVHNEEHFEREADAIRRAQEWSGEYADELEDEGEELDA